MTKDNSVLLFWEINSFIHLYPLIKWYTFMLLCRYCICVRAICYSRQTNKRVGSMSQKMSCLGFKWLHWLQVITFTTKMVFISLTLANTLWCKAEKVVWTTWALLSCSFYIFFLNVISCKPTMQKETNT